MHKQISELKSEYQTMQELCEEEVLDPHLFQSTPRLGSLKPSSIGSKRSSGCPMNSDLPSIQNQRQQNALSEVAVPENESHHEQTELEYSDYSELSCSQEQQGITD